MIAISVKNQILPNGEREYSMHVDLCLNLELHSPFITSDKLLKEEKQVYKYYKHINNRFVLSVIGFIEGLKAGWKSN
ncbi:MAG: hypothetical protein ABR936_11985 [Bacteroidota bacterium]